MCLLLGYIDLSKRRVSAEEVVKCEEKFAKAKAVSSMHCICYFLFFPLRKCCSYLIAIYTEVSTPCPRKNCTTILGCQRKMKYFISNLLPSHIVPFGNMFNWNKNCCCKIIFTTCSTPLHFCYNKSRNTVTSHQIFFLFITTNADYFMNTIRIYYFYTQLGTLHQQ